MNNEGGPMPPDITAHSKTTVSKITRYGTGIDRQNLNDVQGS